MLDNIKMFYGNDVFFTIHFESLSKESRFQEEIDKKNLPMFWIWLFYITSLRFVLQRCGIIEEPPLRLSQYSYLRSSMIS